MIREILKNEIEKAMKVAFEKSVDFSVEVPANSEHGDYSSNAALVLGEKGAAEKIKNELEQSKEIKKYFSKIEIAGPGFLNFWVSEKILSEKLKALTKLKKLNPPAGRKNIQVEFISANPTGELHIGHGRSAFFGDVLANILEFAGYKVWREYFINDSKESNQIKELGKTALGKGTSYLTEKFKTQIANRKSEIENLKNKNLKNLEGETGYLMAQEIQKDNQKFIEKDLGIKFQRWFSEERELRMKKKFERILALLKKKNLTYEKDRALWLKTSEFGDDEDRVLVRSDGAASYFLSDIAYHSDKFKRGFEKIINIWGADHQGHVKRMLAVKKIFSWKGDLEILITQLATIKEAGEVKKLSKRKGDVILLEDLLKEVGPDVLRWFFLEKSLSTHMEFDMVLAKEQSDKNPVFYVQYAGARMQSILAKSEAVFKLKILNSKQFKHPSEIRLIKKLIQFPEVIVDIVKDYQVHRLTSYVYELAYVFSIFYRDVKVLGSEENEKPRLALVFLTRQILGKSLSLLGISVPERM